MAISLFKYDIKPKKEKFEMKKKGLNLLVATFVLICCIICSFALVACSKNDANGYVGTYYEYKNGQKTDFWIKLDKDAWSSSDETGGRLELNGEEVTAYAKIFGEEDVFFTGTVKDGVLTYSMIRGMEYKAYKDGAYENGSTGNENNPNNPDTSNKETFTVTFNTVGGSSVSNATVSSGNTIAAPADPTKSGYNFVGWYSDSSYTNKWQFTTPVRSNITLYAKWEAQIAKYTVSFDSNGGSAVTSVQVNDGDKLTAPTQPVRKMYVFNGWYKDSGFTQVWDFDTDTVTKNITLYAKWKEEEVRITSVNNATIADNEITMVVSEGTDDVDMNGKVVLNNPNATWKLYYDKLGQMEIPTKLATNKNETLGEGSNLFYIVVTNANGTQTKNYVLDIYKKYEVKVAVYGLNGTTPIDTLSAVTLETMPTPTATVTGYTIVGWDSTSVAPGKTLPKDSPRLINLTAKLKANTYKVTLDGKGGTLDETEYNAIFDSAITLPVPAKEGYTFIGWYKGDEKVTNGKGQTTWTIARDTALTAKYRANVYSVTADKNISAAGTVSASGNADSAVLTFDNNGRTGATERDPQTVTYYYGMSVPTPPKADEYLFTGWYNEPACKTRFDFTENIYCDTTAYAGWYYTGTSSTVRYMYEYSSEIQVTTSDDYQYIYFAPVTSGTYYLYYKNSTSSSTNAARMTVYNKTKNTNVKSETSVTNTSYTSISFTANAGDIYYVRVGKYSSSSTFSCYLKPSATTSDKGYFRTPDNVASAGFQSRVSLRATTNNGYTFIGWYKGKEKVSSDLSMTITAPSENVVYTAKWYKLDLQLSDTKAGSVGGLTKAYKVGDSATITATTNAGYTFIGWYDGETKLSDELSYTFNMPSENSTYTAKWILCPVTLEKNIEEAGNVSGVEKTILGKETTITATTNVGYTWVGWYDGETKLTDELSYTFEMPSGNRTYTAKFEKCIEHILDDNCVCTKCGKTAHSVKNGNYCRHENAIYFGAYPQTKVTEDDITTELNNMAGTLPTADNSANWTSYGYYRSGSVSNFMWYIDEEYNGEKYRGVYFTSYRPGDPQYDGYSYQSNNDYNISTVYWFKYEPIKWRILTESDGKALILADVAIDCQQYDYTGGESYGRNNYANSTIRAWLNNTFYNTAFNSLQKELIQLTEIDNSASSTGVSDNSYTCENTNDNIFLLSYKEVTTYLTNDSERLMICTDYACSQGCIKNDYKKCRWWLRSTYHYSNDAAAVLAVSVSGEISTLRTWSYCKYIEIGVVPALWIKLN